MDCNETLGESHLLFIMIHKSLNKIKLKQKQLYRYSCKPEIRPPQTGEHEKSWSKLLKKFVRNEN